jgi:hypothetical protein
MKIETFTFVSALAEKEDEARAIRMLPTVSLFERCALLKEENKELKRRVSFLTWTSFGLMGAFAIAMGLIAASVTHIAHVEPSHFERSAMSGEANLK